MRDVADEQKATRKPGDALMPAEHLLENNCGEEPEQQSGEDGMPNAAMIGKAMENRLTTISEQNERAEP